MPYFDNDFVDDLLYRLERARHMRLGPPLAVHDLIAVLKYSMGRRAEVPAGGNLLTKYVLGPLLLNGLFPFSPRWVAHIVASNHGPAEEGDLESLHAVLEEYLFLVQAGELNPREHPAFGRLGVDGWAKFHLLHFEYYLRCIERRHAQTHL